MEWATRCCCTSQAYEDIVRHHSDSGINEHKVRRLDAKARDFKSTETQRIQASHCFALTASLFALCLGIRLRSRRSYRNSYIYTRTFRNAEAAFETLPVEHLRVLRVMHAYLISRASSRHTSTILTLLRFHVRHVGMSNMSEIAYISGARRQRAGRRYRGAACQ